MSKWIDFSLDERKAMIQGVVTDSTDLTLIAPPKVWSPIGSKCVKNSIYKH